MNDIEKVKTEYLSTSVVAKHLGVSTRTVQTLIHRKEMPALRVGRNFRIRRDHLKRYIAENSTSPELGAKWDSDADD